MKKTITLKISEEGIEVIDINPKQVIQDFNDAIKKAESKTNGRKR